MAFGSRGILHIVFGKTRGQIGSIEIDATVSEEHFTSARVSENPLEHGSFASDHVELQPARLTIEGVISDSPLGLLVVSNIVNIANTIATVFGKNSRSIDGYNALLDLQTKRQPFTVTTGLKVYENMVLTELSVPRTAQTGNAIHFRAVMQQVRIAVTRTTGDVTHDDVADLASPTIDQGQTVTDPVPAFVPVSSNPSAVTGVTQAIEGANFTFDEVFL